MRLIVFVNCLFDTLIPYIQNLRFISFESSVQVSKNIVFEF